MSFIRFIFHYLNLKSDLGDFTYSYNYLAVAILSLLEGTKKKGNIFYNLRVI